MKGDCENSPRVIYYPSGITFLRICPKCGRFVTADREIQVSKLDESRVPGENAECMKCGRVTMPFLGYF